MPRVAQQPRRSSSNGSRKVSGSMTASPFKTPLKIPLNDDAQEKAKRLHTRHVLHEVQMNQIKAAASPMRRVINSDRADSTSPNSRTPRRLTEKENDADDDDDLVVGGNVVTPMKRVPILANFEEWMKMATDNKINAANSWSFALIDYFHDMSLLKEGDGVNFQKASCTLDGCVKIYTSRVDSVATETGKLLSGLADSGNKKKKGESEEGEESEEEVEDEDGVVRKKPKRKTQRSSEATLAPSFAPLQLRRLDLEFSVDPLFKKASADFDEGGAKGLLLNHLAIDSQGRIVFDSSDDAGDVSAQGKGRKRKSEALEEDEDEDDTNSLVDEDSAMKDAEEEEEDVDIDIGALGAKFFPDLERLEEQDICPSLKNFDLGDPSGSMDIPFLKAPEDWRQEREKTVEGGAMGDKTGIFLDDDNPAGFDDDDDLGGFDLPADTGFGEGGEAWAKDAAIEPQMRVHDAGLDHDEADGDDAEGMANGSLDPQSSEYVVSLGQKGGGHEDILSYFDQALQKNWAGPEHWRIRKIKDINKAATTIKPRKEKEPFEIDFMSPLERSVAESIYTPAASSSTISMPKKDWKSKTRNLLPDDKHFNSKQLLRLFLKPKAHMGSQRRPLASKGQFGLPTPKEDDVPEGEMDEGFWARKEDPVVGAPQGDYDADFFQDDALPFAGMDDDDDFFADARDHFSPGPEGNGGIPGLQHLLQNGVSASQHTAYGENPIGFSRRARPEYVQYARVAKKVDVRRLKEELWKGTGIADKNPTEEENDTSMIPLSQAPPYNPENGPLKFTSMMQNLQNVYPERVMNDISTSYCFICLLHLANEKGLTIEKQEGLQELNITIDPTAEITVGGD